MDPIADMIAQIKTANLNKEKEISVTFSHFKSEILNVLKRDGYIKDFSEKALNNTKSFQIEISYHGKKPAITQIRKISKPGLRIYSNYKNIPRPLNGLGEVIISTSKGVMNGMEAKKKKLGGELICEVY